MSTPRTLLRIGAGIAAWEAAWWFIRQQKRKRMYDKATALALRLGRPLIVVGAPDRGTTRGPGCGDVTVDIAPSLCPRFVQADICARLPFEDDSTVVFVSCVLEYVADAEAAMRELRRIAGPNLYIARVEPWTLTAYLYPGARRRLPGDIEATGSPAGDRDGRCRAAPAHGTVPPCPRLSAHRTSSTTR